MNIVENKKYIIWIFEKSKCFLRVSTWSNFSKAWICLLKIHRCIINCIEFIIELRYLSPLSMETIVFKFWIVRSRWYVSAVLMFLENSESEQIHSRRSITFIDFLALAWFIKAVIECIVVWYSMIFDKIVFVNCLNGHNKSICLYEFSKLRNFSYWGPDRMMQNQMFILVLNNWTILNWISKS